MRRECSPEGDAVVWIILQKRSQTSRSFPRWLSRDIVWVNSVQEIKVCEAVFSPPIWNNNLHGYEISIVIHQWEFYLKKRGTEEKVIQETRNNETSQYVACDSKYWFLKLVSFTCVSIKYRLGCNMKYVYTHTICVCGVHRCACTQASAGACV